MEVYQKSIVPPEGPRFHFKSHHPQEDAYKAGCYEQVQTCTDLSGPVETAGSTPSF